MWREDKTLSKEDLCSVGDIVQNPLLMFFSFLWNNYKNEHCKAEKDKEDA